MSVVSQREFARRNGVSPTAISDAVRTGRLPSVGGKINPVEAGPVWARIKDPARAGRKLPRRQAKPNSSRSTSVALPSGPTLGSFDAVKTEREKVRLARDRVELERLLGRVVNVAEVDRQMGGKLLVLRTMLLSLGHRLAPRLALETDAGRCKELVDGGVREALDNLPVQEGPQ